MAQNFLLTAQARTLSWVLREWRINQYLGFQASPCDLDLSSHSSLHAPALARPAGAQIDFRPDPISFTT